MSIIKKIATFFNSKFFLIFSVVCFIYIQGTQSDHFFKWFNPQKIVPERSLTIHTDGAGYYAHLPRWFIYRDNYQFLEKITSKYHTDYFISGIPYDYNKHYGTNKYYIGTAICSTPLFLINHSFNKIVYHEGDGYSRSYQLTVSLNAILYWLFGVIALILLLQKWKLKNFWIVLSIAIITFGTNLNFYTVYFPSFSHVFSFAAISWFIYIASKWAENKKTKYLILLSLLLGMIFLIRPTNILIVLIVPFLFENWSDFIKTLQRYLSIHKKTTIVAIVLFLLLISLQMISVYSEIGKFKLNTYTNEGFDFLFDPQILNVLFSYRKGFFVYAPIMILTPIGLIMMFKWDRYKAIGITIVGFLFLYLTASWWCWWYGGGHGMRPFIDILPLLAIPIALLLKYGKTLIKTGVIAIAFCGIWVYQIYQIQYHLNIIIYDGMTKESFWNVFMKTDLRYAWSAAFVDEHLPKEKPYDQVSYFLNPSNREFSSQKMSSQALLFKDLNEANPEFTYIPDPKWKNAKIGVISKGKISITQPNGNPFVELIYYKNDSVIRKFASHIGYRIHDFNVLTPYYLEFNPGFKYGHIDSIHVTIGKSEVPTRLQEIEVHFFAYPSKK